MAPLQILTIAVVALVGLAVGSFLNVVIARVPDGSSVISPRSKCPRCETELANRDNIPILSWLALRGKCRTCSTPISPRYPIVEIATAIIWAGIAAYTVARDAIWLLPLLLVASAILIALFVIDLDHKRLPDRLTFLLYPVAVAGLVIDGLATGEWPIIPALAGAGCWLFAIGGIWFLSGGRGMGMGDVKLAPSLGLILGWIGVGPAVVGLMAAWLIGGAVAIGLLVARRARSGTAIPFGPFLIGGFAIGLVFGTSVAEAYIGALGLLLSGVPAPSALSSRVSAPSALSSRYLSQRGGLMRAWIEIDGSGRQYLTRVGSGLVLSVTPIGDRGPVDPLADSLTDHSVTVEAAPFHRIAILIDGAVCASPAIRFQASAILATDDPMFATAMQAIRDEESYSFTIEWHRHEYVPADLPIDSLDLALDTRGVLIELVSMRQHATAIPDSVPVAWSFEGGE
ncbi:MAG: prepilin peptidase [Candidatus Nanopelagicales bacterium]